MSARNPDELDAEAYALEARACTLHAEAARLRAQRVTTNAGAAWKPIDALGIARKTGRALAKSGAIETKLVGGRLYANVASFDAFMRSRSERPSANNDDLARELGIEVAS